MVGFSWSNIISNIVSFSVHKIRFAGDNGTKFGIFQEHIPMLPDDVLHLPIRICIETK